MLQIHYERKGFYQAASCRGGFTQEIFLIGRNSSVEDDIHKREQLPDIYTWEDWMWEISTWYRKLYHQMCEVDAYRLLRRLQGHVIPPFIPGLAVEYIQGTSMDSLKPSIDLPLEEAETVSDRVMDAFRAIKDEMCVLHNDVHIGNLILRATDKTPVIIDFGYAMIREPNMSDVNAMRSNLENGKRRRKQTPRPMSDYTRKHRTLFHFNKTIGEQGLSGFLIPMKLEHERRASNGG
ncbi:hypothetical protein F5146DRAFT_1004890 [Armillaria mellea]|nr:hypothetical protein F5146DRAFT_1004890 [Armillaria mellea]